MTDILTNADELARKAADAMFANDHAAKGLGISIDKVGPGYALLSMTVRQDMVNGHDTCHGGFTFALADTAFAYACNSHNVANVAAGAAIEYLRPGNLGDRLSAEAVELNLGRRTGVYDIRVTNQDNKLLALFRGKSASLNRPVSEN